MALKFDFVKLMDQAKIIDDGIEKIKNKIISCDIGDGDATKALTMLDSDLSEIEGKLDFLCVDLRQEVSDISERNSEIRKFISDLDSKIDRLEACAREYKSPQATVDTPRSVRCYQTRRTGTLMSSLGIVSKKESVVSKFGQNENLPLYNWPVDVSEIKDLYDIGMVVSFGNLIPKNIIDGLPLGCINVHASLLPRWRGAAPIIHAIMAGDIETGVTIMRIHPHKFDVGEIIRQYRVPIEWNETAVHLEKKLATLGSRLLMECLRDLKNSLDMAISQPSDGITYAPKVIAGMARVNWTTSDAKSVFNLHRAVSHLHPLKTYWYGIAVRLKRISIDQIALRRPLLRGSEDITKDLQKSAANFLNSCNTEILRKKVHQVHNSDSGKCFYDKSSKLLRVMCADGEFIVVEALQIGSKYLTPVDFYNGYLSKRMQSEWMFS